MNCLNVPDIMPSSPSKSRGQIQVIFGPMFSGKSTELMRRVRRFQIAQYKCLVIKYAKDTRYSKECLATHDQRTMAAVSTCNLKDIIPDAMACSVIGIDEGQFFPDIVEFCEDMANKGKTVIVAALDGTFQRQAFGEVLNLVPLAESVVKLNSVCMECYREAAYTKRLGAEKEVEVIGGADKYHSVCRLCYFQKQPQPGGKENSYSAMDIAPCLTTARLTTAASPRKPLAPCQRC
ncbi:thymidine kinase, cytosolic [Bombina bombina]|uniref:thymidine kinase, cytosolic n=1 Tax=Bombina bombina TaxID=8345 RepID=UPI00235A8C02|nr:thymidine kinase, cytosolic [Bombina bombina]XP_053562108.1 thymidine kinase, cytosolic [Bombina bombina]